MTATQHGSPGDPYGPAGGAVPGAQHAPAGGPPGQGWHYPPPPAARRGSKLLAAGVITAIVLAAAALIVGIVSLAKSSSSATSATPAATKSTSPPASADTKDADLALCNAIAPLMGENDQFSNAYVRLGDAGTPARDAATPKYITDTDDWIHRIQPVLDNHPDADSFLRRSLQRYIDDQRLVIIDLGPGPLSSYAKVLFSDATGAYTGPTSYCDKLGIKW